MPEKKPLSSVLVGTGKKVKLSAHKPESSCRRRSITSVKEDARCDHNQSHEIFAPSSNSCSGMSRGFSLTCSAKSVSTLATKLPFE
jgi:hypothetical protein